MNTLRRIGLWFGSVLLSVTLVSQLLALLFHWGGPFSGPFFDIFRVAGMMAFPVACLYLPFVIALQDAEERRVWTILSSGILIGPASLLLWCIIAQLWSSDPNLWEGPPHRHGLSLLHGPRIGRGISGHLCLCDRLESPLSLACRRQGKIHSAVKSLASRTSDFL